MVLGLEIIYTSLQNCETLLFFPSKEKSFDPNEIIKILKNKKCTEVIKVNGEHGFTNKSTQFYDEHSSKLSFMKMYDFIYKQNNKGNKTH